MASDKLALAIPTYNRPEILLQNLRAMLPELRAHAIPIYISDDSTTDETQQALEILQGEYPHIHYTRNQPGLGHDRNCLATLALPEADYIWYLGDSMLIRLGVLTAVLAIAEDDYDFIFLNSRVKKIGRPAVVPQGDITPFFKGHAWHLTMTGATIYSRKFQQWMVAQAKPRMYRNFQQLGMIFQYVYASPNTFTQAYWFDPKALEHNLGKQSYWKNNTLQVFARDWVNLLEAFPEAMDEQTRDVIISSHSAHTGIFRFKKLIELRSQDLLNPSTFQEYGRYLTRACAVPAFLLHLLPHVPKAFARAYIHLRYGMRKQP